MFQIDAMSRRPVYEQLIDQVERYILLGVLKANEQLPSIRSLASELIINSNTIQKAYSELDRRGIVYAVPGKGCFVSRDAIQRIGDRKRNNLDSFTDQVREMALAGIQKEEVMNCVENAYAERRASV